jgi:membrane-bound ClpP family serine protease
MNKVRIIGLIILIIGLALHYLMEINGFWIGAIIEIGIGLLIVDKIKKAS